MRDAERPGQRLLDRGATQTIRRALLFENSCGKYHGKPNRWLRRARYAGMNFKTSRHATRRHK